MSNDLLPEQTLIGQDRWFLKTILLRAFGRLVWLLGKFITSGHKKERDHASRDSTPQNILVVRMDVLGDIILSTGFLRELREEFPEARITFVVRAQFSEFLTGCPYIDNVIGLERPAAGLLEPARSALAAFDVCKRENLIGNVDLAIHPRWQSDDYLPLLIMYFSRAPVRLGFSEGSSYWGWKRQHGMDMYLTDGLEDPHCRHEAARGETLLTFLGRKSVNPALGMWTGDGDAKRVEEIMAGAKPGKVKVALAPGTRKPRHRWPLDRFSEVAEGLIQNHQCRIFVIGGPEEHENAEELQRRLGDDVVNLAGQTSITQSVELLKRCDLLLSNDSGPVHLASAARLAMVCVSTHPKNCSGYATGSPERFGPWKTNSKVMQPEEPVYPCVDTCTSDTAHCILTIQAPDVLDACIDLLNSKAQTSDERR